MRLLWDDGGKILSAAEGFLVMDWWMKKKKLHELFEEKFNKVKEKFWWWNFWDAFLEATVMGKVKLR